MSDIFKFQYIEPDNIILNKNKENYGTFIEGTKSGITLSTLQQPTDITIRSNFYGGNFDSVISVRNSYNVDQFFGGSINSTPEEGYIGDEIVIYRTGFAFTDWFSEGPFLRLGRNNIISEKSNSKLGIGTLFPQEKVHISGGNLRVEGDVFANNLYTKDNPSGFITGVDLSNYATISNLEATGGNLQQQIDNINNSGFITGVDLTPYATNLNLAATGSTLNTRIDNLSGTLIDDYVTKTNGQFTNRPTVNGTGVLLTEDVAEYVFPNDLIVSLSSGKTFGRYRDGDTILASGKTTSEILQLAIVEPINPDVSLTTSTPTILFNQTGISNILNANTVIKSLNSNVETGFLEWRRGGVGEWAQLTGNSLTGFTFVHSLTDSNFNTSGFNYRYIVIDTVGATNTGSLTITPVAYVSPSLSSTSVGSSPVDLGNISGTLSTTINKNSPNVNVTGYQLQYQTGVNWVNIGSLTSISSTPYSLSVIHNDSNLKNITSINYRIQVYDQYQLSTLTMGSRSFLYRNYLGYSPNTILTLSEIELLINSTLSNSKTRTISNVTAGVGNYTYYCYRAAAGDLTSIIQDGAAPVLGAFTKLSDVVGTNAYGASVTYRVYRSNATNAFTSNTLSFS